MCHTDVIPRAEGTFAAPPIITGHEGSNVVDAVGDGVASVVVGDHVVLTFDSCGDCANCLTGSPAYCDTMLFRNLTGRGLDGSTGVTDADGAEVSSRWFGQLSFATNCTANERNVVKVKVDADLPLEQLGPLGCGVQTGAGSVLVALDVQPGSSLVVFGAGAVGLSAVMAAVVADAATIIAGDLVLDPLSTIGKTIIGILEGGVDPHEFIPRMIGLSKDGRFPFDRLIETFPPSKINEAEQSSLSGGTIKPVLVPNS